MRSTWVCCTCGKGQEAKFYLYQGKGLEKTLGVEGKVVVSSRHGGFDRSSHSSYSNLQDELF